MLRVNPRVTFLSKIGYIFIESGSEWVRKELTARKSFRHHELRSRASLYFFP